MYKTTGDRGYIFTRIFNDTSLVDLRIRQPVSFDLAMRTCKNVLNFLKAVPSVTIDDAYIYLEYKTAFHNYTCMIKKIDGALTLLRDYEIAVADEEFSSLTRGILSTWLNVAQEDAIIEVPDNSPEDRVQKTSMFTEQKQTLPAPTPKRRKVKISITYTREVSIDDNTFSSVMDQIDRLCQAQPCSLNNGFTISDASIAIADD